ncbi:MAG: sugar ABC transporter permease [Aquamicrobium sp.]|uniref:carbohydrate ABC transporter permease n=1 Tax=Aquamicrobium sp. TaxID=1872579 RepID=UPI00349E5834|nr:sugar ABC transporter permease [Aquamicrobium sp.]
MRERAIVPFAFLALALIGLAVFRVVPIFIAGVGSLFSVSLMGDRVFVGLGNHLSLFADPGFWQSLRVTLIFNLLINPIQVVLAFILAMLVFRPSPGIVFFRTAFFMPMTFSIALTAVLWSILLDPSLGLVNSILAELGFERQPFFRSQNQALGTMIFIATWKGVGYWMLFLLAGLNGIPKDVYEAAALDGALGWRRFVNITLPLMRRPLVFVLVADTAINFLFFAPVYIITNGGPSEATNLLMFQAYQSAFAYLNMGRSLAISTIILLVIAIFAVIEFRFFRERKDV